MPPKGVVIENVEKRPPGSSVWTTSVIGVAPRPSSSTNARSMSSTSKISVPTPSGCFCSQRHARPPSPTGALTNTRAAPALNITLHCPAFSSSAGLLTPSSSKSSIPV